MLENVTDRHTDRVTLAFVILYNVWKYSLLLQFFKVGKVYKVLLVF